MNNEFQDLNAATKYYSKKLLESSSIETTNPSNVERYKKQLGGEVMQEFFKIKDSTAVIGTYENHKPFRWWMYGEILSEFLNLDPPVQYKYRPELFNQHYDLLEDGRMQYTYSNRLTEFNQFVNIYKKLKENPNSKRAVTAIYTPYDTASDRADSPCTLMQSFLHRNGKLNMTFFMRSWDVFGGFKSYDFAFQSFTLQSLCSWLDMKPGTMGVYTTSLHYYNRDRQNLERLVEESSTSSKRSDKLILDGNLKIGEFYNQLRQVKLCEEAAYNDNFTKAYEIRDKLTSNLFKEICDVYMKKNTKSNK